MKRFLTALLALALALSCIAFAETDAAVTATLVRYVDDFAPSVDSIVFSNVNAESAASLTAADFTLKTLNSYGEAKVSNPDAVTLDAEAGTLTLDFASSHMEVKIDSNESNAMAATDLILTCTDGAYALNYDSFVDVQTLVADDFNFYTVTADELTSEYGLPAEYTDRNGETVERVDFTYYMYEPESDEALPLVLTLHGGGKNDIQLWDTPMGVTFADPAFQAEHPCYVMAPSSSAFGAWTEEALQVIMSIIDEYIAEGKVDANRLYVMGHSMGGGGTINTLYYYPDRFAAAMPTSTGLLVTGEVGPDQMMHDVSYEDMAAQLVSGGTKIWISGNTSDPTVPIENTRIAYAYLYLASGKNSDQVKYQEYSDGDIAAMNLSKDFDSIELPGIGKPLYHGGDIVVCHDTARLEWLFQQTRADLSATE